MATEGARLRVGQGGGSGKKLGSCLVRSDSCVASGLSGRFGHTDMVRAGASGSFGDGCPLGSVSEALPINRSPSDRILVSHLGSRGGSGTRIWCVPEQADPSGMDAR